MTKDTRRFSREFKLAALERMEASDNVSALARELGVPRKCLYQWRDRFRLGGAVALRSRGRMTKAESLAMREGCEPEASRAKLKPDPDPPDALSKAQRQIRELERKVGQQQLELDFFQQALRRVREARPRSGAPGGTASTRRSKR